MAGEAASRARRPRWDRLAPAGALAFLLTILLGALAVGSSPPDSDTPAQQIAGYFADHRGGHILDAGPVGLGGFVFYPWFLASLWRATRRVEGDDGLCAPVALIGGITLLGPLLILVTAWGAAALQAGEHRDPVVAATLLDLGNMAFLLVPLPTVVLVVATTLAGRPGTLLPGWLARAGLPLAAIMAATTWLGLGQFSFTLFCAWLAVVAVVLILRGPLEPLPARGSAGGGPT
jgi:hypothetical protein